MRVGGVDAKPLREGDHFIGPFDAVETYDLRAQEQSEDLAALSGDGAMLEAHASVMTFHPVPEEVVALARETGPDYYQAVVRPVVRSTLRRVLAAYRADALDTPGIGRVERAVTEETAQRLRPYHIVFDSISLRTLRMAPQSEAYQAVVETGVKEQEALAARQHLELARQHAEERRAEGRGIAAVQTLISPTLTPALLMDADNRGWSKLLNAPSTHVEVHSSAQPYVLEVEP
jgi:regulator of protease activity HflC (stomatin/prohibitin superfamily)